MISGFYTSAAGMFGQIDQQDAISNNLANCSTAGYKRLRVGFSAFDVEMSNAQNRMAPQATDHARLQLPLAYSKADGRQGEMEDTGSSTNLAIDGGGYFVIKTTNGMRLTRDGNFRLDNAGRLVTRDGDPVMGRRGPIRISGGKWEVETNGQVKVNGGVVDTLRIAFPEGAAASKKGKVLQGRIESSNVNAVEETAAMITALRAYEANQKAIQAIDQSLDKIINQVMR